MIALGSLLVEAWSVLAVSPHHVRVPKRCTLKVPVQRPNIRR
jgi:hypothetical protein